MQTYEELTEKKKQLVSEITELRNKANANKEEYAELTARISEIKANRRKSKEAISNKQHEVLKLQVAIFEAKQTKRNGGMPINPQ